MKYFVAVNFTVFIFRIAFNRVRVVKIEAHEEKGQLSFITSLKIGSYIDCTPVQNRELGA